MEIKTNGFKMPNGDIHTFIPPSPTETERGGIKAKNKTTETLEIAVDTVTGKAYSPTSPTDNTLSESNKAADAKVVGDEFNKVKEYLKGKLDKNQGAENAGKALVVGEDGNVVSQEETTKVEVDSTLTQSGKAADAKATGDKILQFAIKNTVTGDNPLIVSDSAEEKMQGLKVFGKSEQVQITGAQLFNINDLIVGYYTTDGNVDEANINRLSTKLLDLQSGQTDLYIAGLPVNVKVIYIQMGVSGVVNRESGIMSNIKKKIETNTTRIGFSFYKDDNSAVSREELSNCMINYGVSAKPYEPYTGGKPSPSPECPQEIVNAGEKGNVTVDVNTGNLFDINAVKKYEVDNTTLSLSVSGNKIIFNSKISTGKEAIMNILGKNNDAIKLPLGKYILSYKSNKPFGSTNGTDTVEMYACVRTGDSTVYRSTGTKNYVIFEIKEGDELFLRFDINKSGQSAEFYDIMINKGESILPYESYFNQSLALPTPNGLPGIKVDTGGNYTDSTGQQWITDEIDLARGKYVQRAYVLDVPPIIRPYGMEANNETTRFLIALTKKAKDSRYPCLCNVSKHERMWSADKEGVYADVDNLIFRMSKTLVGETEDSVKKYLESADIKVLYLLATPIETDLPPETIEAFKTLHTNYPTTVIYNDENAGMEVSYVADTKHYIDKKFEELNQAIVNTQIALL